LAIEQASVIELQLPIERLLRIGRLAIVRFQTTGLGESKTGNNINKIERTDAMKCGTK